VRRTRSSTISSRSTCAATSSLAGRSDPSSSSPLPAGARGCVDVRRPARSGERPAAAEPRGAPPTAARDRQLLVGRVPGHRPPAVRAALGARTRRRRGSAPGSSSSATPSIDLRLARADLASYEGFLARMMAAGGETARLSLNFRSVPAVLAEVERAVAPVMIAEPGVQPRFEPLTPGPALAASPGSGGEIAIRSNTGCRGSPRPPPPRATKADPRPQSRPPRLRRHPRPSRQR